MSIVHSFSRALKARCGRVARVPVVGATLLLAGAAVPAAVAATAEVTQSGSTYIVRVDGAQTYAGNSYTGALLNAAGTGGRVMNVRVGGAISQQIQLRSNTTLNYYPTSSRVTANLSGSGPAFYSYKSSGIVINGLRIGGHPGYGIRLSSCPSPRVTNVDMDFGGRNVPVGLRIDNEGVAPSHVTGAYVRNVRVANTAYGADNQGVETAGIDRYDISGVTGVNIGGCALLINTGNDGTIGTVTGDRAGNGTGYAAMRFANDCYRATVGMVYAYNCGRGIFILNSHYITVNDCYVTNAVKHGIWIQYGSNDRVLSGEVVGGAGTSITESPGSSINVTRR